MSLKTNYTHRSTLVVGAVLIGVMGAALGACGRVGVLEQPAPLFGERAKADYAAKRAAVDAQANDRQSNPAIPAADQPDPNADNAPRTTRDIKDPAEENVPISQQPIQGAPDLMGPTPTLKPPT